MLGLRTPPGLTQHSFMGLLTHFSHSEAPLALLGSGLRMPRGPAVWVGALAVGQGCRQGLSESHLAGAAFPFLPSFGSSVWAMELFRDMLIRREGHQPQGSPDCMFPLP